MKKREKKGLEKFKKFFNKNPEPELTKYTSINPSLTKINNYETEKKAPIIKEVKIFEVISGASCRENLTISEISDC